MEPKWGVMGVRINASDVMLYYMLRLRLGGPRRPDGDSRERTPRGRGLHRRGGQEAGVAAA